MRIRMSDCEMAAAFTGLARLRPDVVVTRTPTRGSGKGGSEFQLGLVGSLSSEARTAALGTLVRGWTAQLRREQGVDVEVL